jgi:hypothetical protein
MPKWPLPLSAAIESLVKKVYYGIIDILDINPIIEE